MYTTSLQRREQDRGPSRRVTLPLVVRKLVYIKPDLQLSDDWSVLVALRSVVQVLDCLLGGAGVLRGTGKAERVRSAPLAIEIYRSWWGVCSERPGCSVQCRLEEM